MPDSRKQMYGITDMSAQALLAEVDREIFAIVTREPVKVVANAVEMDERYIKTLRYRETEQPSAEARVKFGFAYPSVGQVWAYWAHRMTQPDLFSHAEQRAFHRDYARAGKTS